MSEPEAHDQNQATSVNSHQHTETTPLIRPPEPEEQYSVFTTRQKRLIILTAALASSFSPLSANIYYPSLNSIAKDLGVSDAQINLTITTYMICQGLAPTFMGSLADQSGRRPAYLLCFLIYITGNIALALQHSYPALLVLRAVQSCGSSGTVALASAVAADIITSAERGMYMGMASLGNILAPSLGPVLGGVLSGYLGWRAVFWFLAALAGVFFGPFVLFFPETCRRIVGDGSVGVSRWWNMSGVQWWRERRCKKRSDYEEVDERADDREDSEQDTKNGRARLLNPLSTLRLLFYLPTGLLLIANGMVFASYYAVTSAIPAQFALRYHIGDLGIGICFIPAGIGSLCSAICNGTLVDWNYRRLQLRARTGEPESVNDNNNNNNKKRIHEDFPIEKARLQIGLPMMLAASLSIAAYGLLLDLDMNGLVGIGIISNPPPLIVALVLVFVVCFTTTAAYNVMNVLIVDLHYSTPATAMAANNLVRCFLGAGATAAVNPMIARLGTWWTYLIVAGCMVAVSPLLVVIYRRGAKWRKGL